MGQSCGVPGRGKPGLCKKPSAPGNGLGLFWGLMLSQDKERGPIGRANRDPRSTGDPWAEWEARGGMRGLEVEGYNGLGSLETVSGKRGR